MESKEEMVGLVGSPALGPRCPDGFGGFDCLCKMPSEYLAEESGEKTTDHPWPLQTGSLENSCCKSARLLPARSAQKGRIDYSLAGLEMETSVYYCCPLCAVPAFTQRHETLKHLKEVHQVVIDDIDKIVGLQSYLRVLRESREGQTLPLLPSPDGIVHISEKDNPAEIALRTAAHQRALAGAMQLQEEERLQAATMEQECLFCSEKLLGRSALCLPYLTFDLARTGLFMHMREEHGFWMGHPDNLVFIDELLACLREAIKRQECLYCRRIFRTPAVLRLHMRKKKHFRIHPKDRTYDHFYLLNYLDRERPWHQTRDEPDEEDGQDSTDGQSAGSAEAPLTATNDDDEGPGRVVAKEEETQWREVDLTDGRPDPSEATKCLFCEEVFPDAEAATRHHAAAHGFDLHAQCMRPWGLDFYECVMIINFIRAKPPLGIGSGESASGWLTLWMSACGGMFAGQVAEHRCPYCGGLFESPASLCAHFNASTARARARAQGPPTTAACTTAAPSAPCPPEKPAPSDDSAAPAPPGAAPPPADEPQDADPANHCAVQRYDPTWRSERYLFATLPGDPLLLHVDSFEDQDDPRGGQEDDDQAAPVAGYKAKGERCHPLLGARQPLFEGDALGQATEGEADEDWGEALWGDAPPPVPVPGVTPESPPPALPGAPVGAPRLVRLEAVAPAQQARYNALPSCEYIRPGDETEPQPHQPQPQPQDQLPK
ncbi:putative zinc finger protein [Paratrimastix pyriformis]|uniref:Zinc finger protein n=1 Tax=Paratrimastix pyriformis TaxID=342808 RepID=A0ABQ8UU35_9EUKA|nr:putative zinc finger protein [Paratrimastix pyriformis]